MNVILFDDPSIRQELLPLTFTRPVAKIRVGILTIDEKWRGWLETIPSFQTEKYLQKKFPIVSTQENLLINGAVCPDEILVRAIKSLPVGFFLVKDDHLIAAFNPGGEMN